MPKVSSTARFWLLFEQHASFAIRGNSLSRRGKLAVRTIEPATPRVGPFNQEAWTYLYDHVCNVEAKCNSQAVEVLLAWSSVRRISCESNFEADVSN